MARSARFALTLAVLLAFAGATPAAGSWTAAGETEVAPTGPLGDDQTNETRSDGDQQTTEAGDEQTGAQTIIETEGFDPSYDPTTVLNRVERLRNLSAIQGITLHEYADESNRTYDARDRFAAIRPAGAHALQLYSNGSTERRVPLGYTIQREGAVHIYLMNASDLKAYGVPQDAVLAHEFVHALQFQHDLLTPSRSGLRSEFERWTTDAQLVTTALVEGDAMWVTEQYFQRYAEGNYSVAEYNRTLTLAAWPHSVGGLPYYYGYQFYQRTDNSPEARSAAIGQPPNSTAELLHPGERVERVPLPAPPRPSEATNLTQYHSDTVGELVIRHVFRLNNQSFSRAAAAADGWANDRMYYFTAEGATGPATHWVTAWESEAEAREFADAWRSMLDGNGARSVGNVTVVPASDHAPAVYYVVERDGAVVRITAAPTEELAERLARVGGAAAQADAENESRAERPRATSGTN